MAAKSDKQYRLMAGVMSGSIPATGGLSQPKAKKLIDSTPPGLRSKWSKKKKKN